MEKALSPPSPLPQSGADPHAVGVRPGLGEGGVSGGKRVGTQASTPPPPQRGGGGWGERAILLLLLAVLTLALPSRAADTAPRTLLILASGLSLDDLRAGGSLPSVLALGDAGAVGMLNAAVLGRPTDAASYLSVGASERMAAPDSAGDAGSVPAAEAATWASALSPEACQTYQRRFGAPAPSDAALLHTGLPALLRGQPSESRAAQIGALGDALRSAGRQIGAWGDWRAVLVAMDRRGAVPAGGLHPLPGTQLDGATAGTDVSILVAPDAAGLEALAKAALPLVQAGQVRVLIAIPAPPHAAGLDAWRRLGFIVAAGPDIPSGTLLFSPTTRTPGLAANVDLAPTILAWHQAGPLGGAAGRPLHPIPSSDHWKEVEALDRQVIATANATIPVLLGYGAVAIGSAAAAVLLLWRRGKRSSTALGAARLGLLLSASALIAFLGIGVLAPTSPWLYGGGVLLLSALLLGCSSLAARLLRIPTTAVLFITVTIIVCVDAALGSPVVARSLLSGSFLGGVRFYGIGNEYMGLTLGAALTGPLLLPSPRARVVAACIFWPWLLLSLGLPWLGADAGGALGSTVAFVVAVCAWRTPRLRVRHILLAFVTAFAVVALFAVLDRLRPGDARSHVGAAIATGQARGIGAIAEIALRKIAMNIRYTLTGWTLAAVAGLLPVWLLLTRGSVAERAQDSLARRPLLRRVLLPASLWGAVATLVFNDSGTTAALLLLAPPTVALIDAMLTDGVA